MKHLLIGSFFSLLSLGAQADFINYDLTQTGDALVTHDTDTGLYWLKMSATTNKTMYEAKRQMTGFNIAQADQVHALTDSFFKPFLELSTPYYKAEMYDGDLGFNDFWAQSLRFEALFGTGFVNTGGSGDGHYSQSLSSGMYVSNGTTSIDSNTNGIRTYHQIKDFTSPDTNDFLALYSNNALQALSTLSGSNYGTWMILDESSQVELLGVSPVQYDTPTDVPTPIGLSVLSLLGLSLCRRNKKG